MLSGKREGLESSWSRVEAEAMTKPHSRVVRALGNGGYTTTALARVFGISGLLAMLGAVFWAGSTATRVEEKIAAQTESLNEFVRMQAERDQRQDARMNRQGARLEAVLQRLLNNRVPR